MTPIALNINLPIINLANIKFANINFIFLVTHPISIAIGALRLHLMDTSKMQLI